MISIDDLSDVLRVWAYGHGGQIRLEELRHTFAARLRRRHRLMAPLADTPTRIGEAWQDRGAFRVRVGR